MDVKDMLHYKVDDPLCSVIIFEVIIDINFEAFGGKLMFEEKSNCKIESNQRKM